MAYDLSDVGVPRAVLVVLIIALAGTLLFAISTSSVAFSTFNGAWDGTSELRSAATAAGADSEVVVNTTAYETIRPSGTVALVLPPDRSYGPADTARLRQFVRGGGTLVVAEDFGPHGNDLLAGVGAQSRFDGRLVRDERDYYRSPDLPIAANSSETPVTDTDTRLTLNHATVLEPNNATVAVTTSDLAYLGGRRNDRINVSESFDAYPVVTTERLGEGRVVAVSDPSLFINAMQEQRGNRRFVRELFTEYDTVVLDYSHSERPPVAARLALVVGDTPLLQATIGIVGIGAILLWTSFPRLFGARRAPHGTRDGLLVRIVDSLRSSDRDDD